MVRDSNDAAGDGIAEAADSDATSYWLAASAAGPDRPTLASDETADIVIVGAGFTGLWTTIALTDTDPTLRVAVLEADTAGYGASGRNGGFCSASLTHGLANGIRHFPDELAILEREGLANFRAIVEFTREHEIDCSLEETGILDVADRPHQVEEFRAWVDDAAAWGEELEFMDRERIQAEVHSPLWLAALHRSPGRDAILDPAKLVRGLARVCEERGAMIHEGSRVTAVERHAGRVRVGTAGGQSVSAGHVVVATSAYSGWLRRLSAHFVPVYDYVLVSDPLSAEQLTSIGWERRQGMADANNQFHYFRLTADNRVLWGGYDAIYHFGERRRAAIRPPSDDIRKAGGAVPGHVSAARRHRLPVPLGRRDRHDVALHRDVRAGPRWSADICPRLHRVGCRGEPLGRWRRPRLHSPP